MRRMMCKDEARVKLDFARHLEAEFRQIVSPGSNCVGRVSGQTGGWSADYRSERLECRLHFQEKNTFRAYSFFQSASDRQWLFGIPAARGLLDKRRLKRSGETMDIHMTHNKRRRIGAAFTGALFLVSYGAFAEDRYSAGEMLSDCQEVVDSVKVSKNSDELDLENTFASGRCWGAFLSLQQLVVTKIEGKNTSLLNICAPPETTSLQIIQDFVSFVQQNRRRQDEPFTKVALAALRSAFPCK